VRRLSLFETQGRRHYLRFGASAPAREAKAVLAPGSLRDAHLGQGKAELSDGPLLLRSDHAECISWNCTPSASAPWIDDSGREVVVPA
jgi:hypothetical protein